MASYRHPPWHLARLGLLFGLVAAVVAAEGIASAAATRERYRRVAVTLRQAYVFIGGGSGVQLGDEGLILTNYHVAGEAAEWKVDFADGGSAQAKLLGMDPVGDLVLLALPAPRPGAGVVLGMAADLVIGRPVLAIGNPFSLGRDDHEPTVTIGTLGGIRLVRDNYADCLQFDAPVNPGNSGGPLLDLDGRLLGINGQIRTRSGLRLNSGIGLAIACTQLAEFVPALRAAAGGYVHHAAPPAGLAWEQRDDGVHLTAVPPGVEGLAVGDRLVVIDGRPVTSAATATGCFVGRAYRSDLRLEVVALRGDERVVASAPVGRWTIPGRPWHGLRVLQRRDRLVVQSVEDGSPAAVAGIAAGAVLVSVDGQPLSTSIDWLKVSAAKEVGDRITCRIRTGQDEQDKVILLRLR